MPEPVVFISRNRVKDDQAASFVLFPAQGEVDGYGKNRRMRIADFNNSNVPDKEINMAVQFQVSYVIDRPLEKVFKFYAVDHVRNHPRWDPDIELWLDTDTPIGVGTIIHRRNSRSGKPVEGTMEVVEFEPNRVIATVIREGPAEMHSRATFEALSEDQTRITTVVDIPGMDESMDRTFFNSRLERSGQNIKRLMEAEI